MADFAYLIFNIMAFLSGVFLVRWLHLKLNWRALLTSFLLVSVPFIAWDVFASKEGHWGFNPAYVTGAELMGLPLEEMLFFFSVPFVCLSVYLACKEYMNGSVTKVHYFVAVGVAIAAVITLLLNLGGDYTALVSCALLTSGVVLGLCQKTTIRKAFWLAMFISFGLFFIANTFLTGLPIVTYGEQAILGLRIGTIPIEDFVYNFVLLSLFMIVYDIEEN